MNAFIEEFDEEWRSWFHEKVDPDEFRPRDWPNRIEAYLKTGLNDHVILDSLRVAMRSRVSRYKVWRYFCGVVRNRVNDLQDRAHELLATETEPDATD